MIDRCHHLDLADRAIRPVAKRIATLGRAAGVTVLIMLAGCTGARMASDTAAPGVGVSHTRAAIEPGLFELVHVGNRLYVTSAGDDRRNGEPGHILVVDPETLTVQQSVESAEKPFALVVNRQTQTLYVGHSMDRRVSVYDIPTMKRTAVIQLEGKDATGKAYRSRQLLVDEATNTIYVGSPADDGPIWVIDGENNTLRASIAGAGGPGLAFDAKRSRLYTSGRGFWTVSNARTNQVIARYPVDDKPERYLVNIDVDAATNRVFASDSKHGELLVANSATGERLQTIATGAGAMGVKFNADRNEVYVSNRQAGTISVIDTNTLREKASIAAARFPNSFAIGKDANELFVSVKQSKKPEDAAYRDDKKESIMRIKFDNELKEQSSPTP